MFVPFVAVADDFKAFSSGEGGPLAGDEESIIPINIL